MVMVLDRTGRPRHPEKARNPDTPLLRKPEWIRVKAPGSPQYFATREIVRETRSCNRLRGSELPQYWRMLVAEACNVHADGRYLHARLRVLQCAHGLPEPLDASEPGRVGEAVARMGLAHAVITSVDRDDLEDGGARHFALTVAAIREASPADDRGTAHP